MTTVSEAVAQRDAATPAQVSPRDTLRQLLERNQQAVGASLPSGYSAERFSRLLLTAANTNPELFECDPRSFLAAGVGAAQLGLEPNDPRGLAYLVPFKVRGRKVVQLIIGYRGMLDLARRSGLVSAINAHAVFVDDAFTYRLGLLPMLDHVPHPDGDDDPAKLAYVYAVARVAGDVQFVVLSRRQIDRVRDQYARSTQSPWHTHYVEMALKTALRRLCKWLPQTVELATAVEQDERSLVIGDLAMPGGHSIEPSIDDSIETSIDEGEPEPEQVADAVSAAAPADDAVSAASSGRRRRGSEVVADASPPDPEPEPPVEPSEA